MEISYISFVLTICYFFVGFITSGSFEFKSGMSFFLLEVNTKEKWNISYYKSTAKFSRIIEKQKEQMTLYTDASCDEGQLYLKITQEDIDELIDISGTGGYIGIDLSKYKNGKIKLEIIDENCKGVDFEAYWK